MANAPYASVGLAPSNPVHSQISDLLRAAIIRGEIVPGQRLSEQEVAGRYGLSRQPVREAFIRLTSEDLLEVKPQRGTFVTRINPEAVLESRFIRESVEADIVRHAVSRADPDLLPALKALISRQQVVADSDPAEFMQLDESFHRTIAQAAGRARAWDFLQTLKIHMDRVRFLTAMRFPKETLLDQHGEILAAIAARDADAAEAAMRRHLRMVLQDLPQIIAAHPEFFTEGRMPDIT